MNSIFLHNWDSKEAMIADFENIYGTENLTPEHIAKYAHVDVLLASYGTDNYTGDAFVLFRNTKDGQLYENHGSHCSCYGLEGQWKPEICDLESLRHRLKQGSLGCSYSGNEFNSELSEILDRIKE